MEYSRTARRHWMVYAATNAGLVLCLLAFNTDVQVARIAAIVIGLLLFCSGLLLIIRNWQFGSRVDFETHELVWWEGYPPSDERRIPLERIRGIRTGVDGDGKPWLKLLDLDDEPIAFSSRCAPPPWEIWAQHLTANFPHITLQQSSSVAPTLDPIAAKPDLGTPADLR